MTLIHHAWQDKELERMAWLASNLQATGYTPPAVANILTSGTTFTPLVTGLYRVQCLGGGGGGGGGGSSTTAASLYGFGGGGGAAGAVAEAWMTLTGGTGYTYALGTAGAGGTTTAGATHNGGDGSAGGNTTFTGPSTLVAPGGGQGGGAGYETPATAAVLNGSILTLTLAHATYIQNANSVGGATVGMRSAAGGTWGSAGDSGAGINNLPFLVGRQSGTALTLIYSNGGTVPSGTYTASSALVAANYVNGGVTGVDTYQTYGDEWAPGYGGPGVWIPSITTWALQPGLGAAGLGGGGGGCGGASAPGTSLGGTGASAGTSAGGGAAGSNGASANANGTAGSAAAANTGAGGGGGGGSAAGNAGVGGAGGTGLIVITGPFPASGL